ncbi:MULTISPECIES: hypothetical protein [unclassified Sphingomonas]|uniref:hypothetical protein n=1 Tax=unclassified Sphingomonas TaxID=196159 RepID=UPI000AB29CD7|nr:MULTISPECIES: hypothetical protein [unclassified Sphingomonas]
MRAIPLQATPRHRHRPGDIDPVPLIANVLCLVAALGAAIGIYRWMLDVLGDPIPAAIVTLIVAMAMLVLTNGKARRR